MTPQDAFLEFSLSKDWTPSTRRWYRQRLGRLMAWLDKQSVNDFAALTAPLLRRYVTTLDAPDPTTGRTLDSHTKHGHVRCLRAWLAWGVAEDLLPPGLTKRISLPRREEKVMTILSDAEVSAMLKAAGRTTRPRRDTALLSVLLDTGLRAAEACGLRRQDLMLTPDEAWLLVHGKGRKQRTVGLGRAARLAVQRYLSRERGASTPTDSLFVGRGGDPLTPNGLAQLFYRLRDDAGLPHNAPVHPHAWRHASAVRALAEGEDIYSVSRRLGHADIGVTTGYLKAVSQQQLRQLSVSVLDQLTK